MKSIALIFILLLLINVTAFWSEALEIHTVDKRGRPIPNVQVEISYQQERYTELDGKITAISDSNGIYKVKLLNNVPTQFEKNNIVVKATFAGVSNTSTFQHDDSFSNTPRLVTSTLPVFELKVKLLDAYNKTIKNGAVRVGSNLAYTNSQGLAFVKVPAGNYEILGKYENTQERKISMEITDDTSIDISLPVYNVLLKVIDQYGKPVKALISGNSISTYTNENGELFISQFPYSQATFLVLANSYPSKNLTINAGNSQQYLVTIDSEAPTISNIRVAGNYTGPRKIVAEIIDTGNYSSGLSDALVEYSTDNGTTWNKTGMYPISYKDFEASLPGQKTNTTVLYRLTATDKEGNRAQTETLSYLVRDKAQEPGLIPGFNLDFILLPIVIVIVIVIVFLAYKKYQGEL